MSWAYQPILTASAVQQAGSGTAYSLVASAGAVARDGQSARPLVMRRMPAANGGVSVGGQPVVLTYRRAISAGSAAIALVGEAVGLAAARRSVIGFGGVGISGQAAGFQSPALALGAEAGGFSVAGAVARPLALRRLPAAKATLHLIGRPAALPGEADTPGARTRLDLGLSIGL
jgi:hypothetical protein